MPLATQVCSLQLPVQPGLTAVLAFLSSHPGLPSSGMYLCSLFLLTWNALSQPHLAHPASRERVSAEQCQLVNVERMRALGKHCSPALSAEAESDEGLQGHQNH